MTVDLWITKYALTRGIYKTKGRLIDRGKAEAYRGDYLVTFKRGDFALSEEVARYQQAMKAAARIQELAAEINRLSGLTKNLLPKP